MLTAEVSWRREPGINRAYVWLSDGTIVGYRDLDSGIDYAHKSMSSGLLHASVENWLATFGVPCGRVGPQAQPPQQEPPQRGPRQWLRQRRRQKQAAAVQRAQLEWQLDHPLWRVPTDPPHGGWRDLVRNEPADALWRHLATLPAPGVFELRARQEQRAWRSGAHGEERLARELWRIARPGHWRVLHSVPVGSRGSDIDHLLVGPAGVFTINTKNHAGSNIWVGGSTFMVNGTRQPYIRNSRHEAARASRLLGKAFGCHVNVQAVLAVIDPRNLTIREHPRRRHHNESPTLTLAKQTS